MRQKNWLKGIASALPAAAMLLFGMALSACAPEVDGPFGVGLLGGGSGGVLLVGLDPANEQKIKDLPAFEGNAVSSEDEASVMAIGAMAQITAAATAALSYSAQSNTINRAVAPSGNYSYNGVKLTYSVSTTGSYPTPPYTMDVKELITIDGTYGGYTISGKGMEIDSSITYTSSTSVSIKYKYDCAFTVSYNGKGMKIIYTGSMDITSTGKNAYKLHYTVYNNNNTAIYNFDYDL
ncbi:MAG: hypothetical protein LBG72_10550 [Spirochaetaceae bacterium]|nr:hypothetical protein [Spirochaetaceae bacterium]